MKRITLIALILGGLATSAFSQTSSAMKPFTLRGKIAGKSSGHIILSYWLPDKYIQDTAIIKNGTFTFKGSIIEPTGAEINDGNDLNRTYIYLEPGAMKVMLTKDQFKNAKVTGSKTQEDNQELNILTEQVDNRTDSVIAQISSIRDRIENIKDEANRKIAEKNLEEKQELMAQLDDQRYKIQLKFIDQHPQSYLSICLLQIMNKNLVISLDSLKLAYAKLDVALQNSRNGKEIRRDIAKKENTRVGAIAPDFKATDLNNQLVTLSQFKGKSVVLLDFWASYCSPCRRSFPHIKSLYQKYHAKGFEVVVVSVDFNKEAWRTAVKHDSVGLWYNIPIAEKYAEGPNFITKDDIYYSYFVQSVPVHILIDKTGKIVGRWNGYSEENEAAMDKMLEDLFVEN